MEIEWFLKPWFDFKGENIASETTKRILGMNIATRINVPFFSSIIN